MERRSLGASLLDSVAKLASLGKSSAMPERKVRQYANPLDAGYRPRSKRGQGFRRVKLIRRYVRVSNPDYVRNTHGGHDPWVTVSVRDVILHTTKGHRDRLHARQRVHVKDLTSALRALGASV